MWNGGLVRCNLLQNGGFYNNLRFPVAFIHAQKKLVVHSALPMIQTRLAWNVNLEWNTEETQGSQTRLAWNVNQGSSEDR